MSFRVRNHRLDSLAKGKRVSELERQVRSLEVLARCSGVGQSLLRASLESELFGLLLSRLGGSILPEGEFRVGAARCEDVSVRV